MQPPSAEAIQASAGADDSFLKLDGIEGESTDARHQGEIDVLSWSWGVSNSATILAGHGGGSGKATFDSLKVAAVTSKASPILMLATASGQHISGAVLTARKAGGAQPEFLTITMEDVVVSSYHLGTDAGALPSDQFSLTYAKIVMEYRPQKADGTLAPPITAGWDVKANKKI
jgi:type VI secretion system secreted protein Hcp